MSFLVESDIKEICEGIKDIHSAFEGKRILLTGSNGFLGKYFTAVLDKLNKEYLTTPCTLVLMDNLVVPNELFKHDYEFHKHDISKEFNYDKKIDFIINSAGIASPYWYNKLQMETINVSVDGLRNMLDLSIKNDARLLFFSSSEVYGTPPDDKVPTKEDYVGQIPTLTRRSAYDIGKLMGETLTFVYNELGANAVIVRPFNFSAPGMGINDYRVLPNWVGKTLQGQKVLIYGSGEQTRSLCYITDAIIGCLKVLVKGEKGEAYNIGNPNTETSMLELAATIKKLVAPNFQYELVPSPINYITEPLRRCPDITKAMTQLGYNPTVNLEDVIKRFYNWAKDSYKNNL